MGQLKLRRSNIPSLVMPEIERTYLATQSYLTGLSFIMRRGALDPDFVANHLLCSLSQDLLQSALALPMLATEGMWSVARRELRFILEASIKQTVIQQKCYRSPIGDKLSEFTALLNSSSVACKNRLKLDLLPASERLSFLEELGQLYGAASDYIHLTERQIRARNEAMEAGHTSGFESKNEAAAATLLIARTLAASLVLLFHSIPIYFVGDFFVASDGHSPDWFFEKSRYLTGIDSYFDYKFERKPFLIFIGAQRKAKMEF